MSLGGAGYAAVTVTGKDVKNSSLTGKDVKNSSLTGKDVKNSSLTGKDVKNRSLSGADIKDDGLTGTQVLESQLAKVPSATSADQATRAGSAASVDRVAISGNSITKANIGETKTLVERGPLRVTLVCADADTDTNPDASVKITNSEDDGAFSSALLGLSDPEFDNETVNIVNLTDQTAPAYVAGYAFSAVAASGVEIHGQVSLGANKFGAKCIGGATALG